MLRRSYACSPWHLLPPIYLDQSGAALCYLMNPSGGLVGGDELRIRLHLDRGTRVIVSSPSANRVYRTLERRSKQRIDLTVGAGAVLEWVPELTIPFAGSKFQQTVRATVEPGGVLLFWDALAAGRIARNERWAFASLENDIGITLSSGPALVERYKLEPHGERSGVGLAEGWNYVATFLVIGDTVTEEVWKDLEGNMAEFLERHEGTFLGGVTRPAAPGIAVKLLAQTAHDLMVLWEAVWAATRLHLWGLPMPCLRRY